MAEPQRLGAAGQKPRDGTPATAGAAGAGQEPEARTPATAGAPAAAGAGHVLAASIRNFTYPDHTAAALQDIDLAVEPGSLTAILGASGSGKSTLGRLLAGWLLPGSGGTLQGHLEVSGTRIAFGGTAADPRIDPAAWGRQVGFVPQDAAAILSTVRATVAEELAFGLENQGTAPAAMREAVTRTAGLLGLSALLDRRPDRLSGGQLRRLAIGCAVITGPPLVLMDEPYASLDAAGSAGLADFVRNLNKAGTAVVILGQAIDPPLLDADSWLIVDRGTVVTSGTPDGLMSAPALLPAGIRRAAGRQGTGGVAAGTSVARAGHPAAGGSFAATPVPAAPGVRNPQAPRLQGKCAPALQLTDVTFGFDAPPTAAPATAARATAGRPWRSRWRRAPAEPTLEDPTTTKQTPAEPATTDPALETTRNAAVDAGVQPAWGSILRDLFLEVHPGEIVAITGPNGVGKSTLLRMFNGLLRPVTGKVLVNGADIAGVPVGRTAAHVGLLFQHPRDQLFERSLLREVQFGLDHLDRLDRLDRLSPLGRIDAARDGQAPGGDRALAALAQVGLADSAGEHPAELPGSHQRLLALATVLARRPAVLALDEPTVGLDGNGLAVLDAAVRSAAEAGAAVVLVTHDVEYARTAAHRILRLTGGSLVPG